MEMEKWMHGAKLSCDRREPASSPLLQAELISSRDLYLVELGDPWNKSLEIKLIRTDAQGCCQIYVREDNDSDFFFYLFSAGNSFPANSVFS